MRFPSAIKMKSLPVASIELRPVSGSPGVVLDQVIAAYRGKSCVVQYAEALRVAEAYPREIF